MDSTPDNDLRPPIERSTVPARQTRPAQIRSILFITLGWLMFAIGFIGIFVPLLPTTPFMLLAAYCFSNGSERLHNWLYSHRRFGPMLTDWDQHGVIRPRAKWTAVILICTSLSYPLFFKTMPMGIKAVAGMVGLGAILFIVSRPSREVGPK